MDAIKYLCTLILTCTAAGLYSQPIPFRDGKKWGFMDYETQRMSIHATYKEVGVFSEGLAAFRKGKKWGYIKTDGKEVIPPAYKTAGAFMCGTVASVTLKRRNFMIDANGKETRFKPIDCGMEDLILHGQVIAVGGKFGYASCCPPDTILPARYDKLMKTYGSSAQSILIAKHENYWGVIDTAGAVIVPFEYDSIISERSSRILILRKGDSFGAFGLRSGMLIAAQHKSVQALDNYIRVELSPGIFGYIDDKGRKYWR